MALLDKVARSQPVLQPTVTAALHMVEAKLVDKSIALMLQSATIPSSRFCMSQGTHDEHVDEYHCGLRGLKVFPKNV